VPLPLRLALATDGCDSGGTLEMSSSGGALPLVAARLASGADGAVSDCSPFEAGFDVGCKALRSQLSWSEESSAAAMPGSTRCVSFWKWGKAIYFVTHFTTPAAGDPQCCVHSLRTLAECKVE
jgi:hypothetical protein